MNHTPTPWKYEAYDSAYQTKQARLIHVEDDGYELQFARGLDVDDAAFIVEACNAHEGLKKEMDDLLEKRAMLVDFVAILRCERDALLGALWSIPYAYHTTKASKALALCEGKETP